MDDSAFSREVLSRLPLADAVWRLLQFSMADDWLEDLWSRTRGRCYERVLKFSTLAHLVADALLEHGGSGRQAFERAQEDHVLPVAIGSAFEKLGNLPPAVSEALLLEGTRRLQETLPGAPAVEAFPLPGCWAGHALFGADGKAIKHVKRLLKPLRGLQAGILGARASVALDLRTGMAVGLVGHLDGEAGEAELTKTLLATMAAAADGKPWVAVLDRLYCNLKFPRAVLAAGGHFLIRYCSNTAFVPDPARPAQEGRDARGRRIVQEWGRLGKTEGSRALLVRRITLYLDSGQEIGVVTDLLDEAAYPGEDLLETFRQRWGIETVFHQITDVFSLKHLIASPPQAVLFQLAFCLLLYNALQVLRAYLAFHQGCEAQKISNEKLFYDLKRQMVSVNELVEEERLLELLGAVPTAAELRDHLRANLQGVWSRRWWKAPSSRGGGHQKVKTRVLGNHTSVYRVLQQART
jgi:Transposase DDE domain